MKVIVRANNTGAADADVHEVVVEIRVGRGELAKQAMKSPKLETTLEEAIEEHLRCGTRIVRMVDTGRG